MVENRRQDRRRILKGAIAVLPTGGTIDCVVKDISDAGARLQVANVLSIPDHFELRVLGKPPVQVEVVWRKMGLVGVRFVEP